MKFIELQILFGTGRTMASKNFKGLPEMRDDLPYEDWRSDVEVWSDFTDMEAEKQGQAVFLTLVGKARQTVRAGVDRTTLKSSTGLSSVLSCLDKLYKKDESSCGYSAYEDFSDYRRPDDMSIKDYLVEFNIKYCKLKSYKMTLPDGVLAFYLLKCANLTNEQSNICKATCAELKYDDMKKQIERVTSSAGRSDKASLDVTVQPQFYNEVEDGYDQDYYYYDDSQYESEVTTGTEQYDGPECETYYAQQRPTAPQYQYRPRGARRGGPLPPRSGAAASAPRLNTPDEYGNPTRCDFCRSTYHYVGQCPDAAKQAALKGRGAPSPRRPGRGGRGNYMRGGRGNYI